VNHWLARGFEPLGGKYEQWERAGGVVRFPRPTALGEVVQAVKQHLGVEGVQLALPDPGRGTGGGKVSRLALCAGSGGEAMMERGGGADCWVTGEMQHHDVLAAVAQGKTVLLCGHTNTERGYLPTLREKLLQELVKEDSDEGEGEGEWEVEISPADGHPLTLV